ncbi:MAG: neutral zinc metallopeptidase [Demequinaceae bacterium]|nr:neutral zinc metallopeptidase [Demequinaceae bacterium]
MTFREDARLDPSRIQRRGRGTGASGMAVGGGLGGVILLVVAMLFGFDLSSLGFGTDTGSSVTAADPEIQADFEAMCQSGTAANESSECRVVGAINSLDAYWSTAVPAAGAKFTYPGVVVFDSMTSTACGTASSQTGPFYCPSDQTIYIDTTFFDVLVQQFGSSDGPLAQMYVVAHEYGHHIQQLLGVFNVADRGGAGADSDSVKVELMADCLAGVWANHAATTPGEDGKPYLEPLTKQDVKDAIDAARSVGDDRIMEASQGYADPDNFTHGTSEQRAEYFLTGYRSGSPNSCDLFDVID